jgi:hypothetical protein
MDATPTTPASDHLETDAQPLDDDSGEYAQSIDDDSDGDVEKLDHESDEGILPAGRPTRKSARSRATLGGILDRSLFPKTISLLNRRCHSRA